MHLPAFAVPARSRTLAVEAHSSQSLPFLSSLFHLVTPCHGKKRCTPNLQAQTCVTSTGSYQPRYFTRSRIVSRIVPRSTDLTSTSMPLYANRSSVREEHCPSTRASRPAPSSPMQLSPRFSSASAEHCPSTLARLPAPSAPRRFYLLGDKILQDSAWRVRGTALAPPPASLHLPLLCDCG